MIKNMKNWYGALVSYLIKRGHEGHTATPVLNPSGKSLLTRPCPICKNPHGFVFQSEKDSNIFLLACKQCKNITIRERGKGGAPNNPINAATQGMLKGVKSLSCTCGAPLPEGRKKFCYMCRPLHKGVPTPPKEEDSQKAVVY